MFENGISVVHICFRQVIILFFQKQGAKKWPHSSTPEENHVTQGKYNIDNKGVKIAPPYLTMAFCVYVQRGQIKFKCSYRVGNVESALEM
jgi:hypothetical protein